MLPLTYQWILGVLIIASLIEFDTWKARSTACLTHSGPVFLFVLPSSCDHRIESLENLGMSLSRFETLLSIKFSPAFCRRVIKQLSEDENWPPGIVFDGRKNIYACSSFFPRSPSSWEVLNPPTISHWMVLKTLQSCNASYISFQVRHKSSIWNWTPY